MRANDGKIDVYLAVLEGICFLMRLKLENLESESGPADERIAVSGGGASSATWMQMLADITGRTIMVVSSSRYAGAIGAARCVLKNSGKKAQVDRTYVPDVHRKARFDTKYHEFIQLFALMVEHKEIRHR
jgi:sugar (pentulose or hexulose) kinase